MPVQESPGKVSLTHPQGASVEILLFGATITSWKSPSVNGSGQSEERLFLSSKAVLDGSKAVRGGIPVVFPCFGPPQHPEHMKLAQHGFARTSTWRLSKVVMDNEAGVSVKLVLETSPEITSVYDKPFELAYVVTLAQHQLSTDLHVTNPGDGTLEFQSLLHTYFKAPAHSLTVGPLQSLRYFDKTTGATKTETRTSIHVRDVTDCVYADAGGNYHLSWPDHSVTIKARGFKDVVIWNPGEGGNSMADMEDGGWNNFVCIEPGYVQGFVHLSPGDTWIGQQVITIQE